MQANSTDCHKTRYCPLWDVMTADPPWCPLPSVVVFSFSFSEAGIRWCAWSTQQNGQCSQANCPFLSEWVKCQAGNTKNGGTVLLIANLMADSESGSPDSYSRFLVNIRLSLSFRDIRVWQTRRQTSVDHYFSWPPHCGGPANRLSLSQS